MAYIIPPVVGDASIASLRKFITAGNVDDGKSTLIGRLLYDTQSIKQDILESVKGAEDVSLSIYGEGRGEDINLAHITDGLRAEREQGITIDVAYKYFSTARTKFIIIDAPGHLQYTKNLVTGASNADIMIILVDAVNGVTAQTRRHALVAAFLGIKNVIFAINKMDLFGYSEPKFLSVKKECEALENTLLLKDTDYLPVSALMGDNVVNRSDKMPWFSGPSILDLLEKREDASVPHIKVPSVFVVQHSIVSDSGGQEYGSLGNIISGSFKAGELVSLNPGEHFAEIRDIYCGLEKVKTASAGQSVCMVFSAGLTLHRGEIISACHTQPECGRALFVKLFWLDASENLKLKHDYILHIGTAQSKCQVVEIVSSIDIDTLKKTTSKDVAVNQFSEVRITTPKPVAFYRPDKCAELSRGILINPESNNTCGVFVVI